MEEQQIQQQVDALLQQVTAPAPGGEGATTPAAPPATIGDVPFEQFSKALETFTGGAVKNPNDISKYLQAAQERDTYAAKIRDFEAKASVSPYASDLVKKVDEMVRSGAKTQEVQRFIEMQSWDVDQMSPADAYKRQLSLKYPGLAPDKIELLVQDEFGLNVGEDEQPNPVALAKLERAGMDAKAFLQQQKVAAENPQAVLQRQQFEQQANQLRAGWSQIVGKVSQNLARDIKQKVDDGEYTFQYKYPQEVLAQASQMAIEQAVANKIPLDQNGYQQVVDFVHTMATALDFQNLQTALLSDAFASAKMAAIKSTSGPAAPVARQAPPPANGQKPVLSDIEKLRQLVAP